ncbi:MinD/ParA/CobQ/CobA-like protein [Stieleria magnilauensis]|uniref:MinD/ParA/CobQ/CobA-like protein n=2 Tax=Stieleria magnilauensis TaxID=2527963 RepID=A0ABX5XWW2_9BACT|nr:MinD/ParA/CobQ/CobA-like protein [Planctomycetes bacterium TBK1r]
MAIGNQQTTSICLINQKGGCGKSSTCFHLAGAFAALGQRVLLVDADPQGSISQAFFGSDAVEQMPAWETLAALFDDRCNHIDPYSLIRETHVDGISVLPANQHLAEFNSPCPERGGVMQYALRDFLEPLSSFDVVLFDCPPNLYQCSWNAMIATQYVLIPIPPEDFGTQGIPAVHQAVTNARILNPSLRRLGHLITRSDRRMLVHQEYESRLRDLYGELVLNTTIPERSAFKVALACRQPVQMHAVKSMAAARTRELVDEIIERINNRKLHKEAA